MRTWLEKQLGSLLALAAVVWEAWHLVNVHQFEGGYLRLGPMQLLMAGLLLWLHGKYRENVHVNRA